MAAAVKGASFAGVVMIHFATYTHLAMEGATVNTPGSLITRYNGVVIRFCLIAVCPIDAVFFCRSTRLLRYLKPQQPSGKRKNESEHTKKNICVL